MEAKKHHHQLAIINALIIINNFSEISDKLLDEK